MKEGNCLRCRERVQLVPAPDHTGFVCSHCGSTQVYQYDYTGKALTDLCATPKPQHITQRRDP